jgi:phenylacetate-CoA ligase
MNPEELEEIRIGRLRDVLGHAGAYVPFYEKRFAEAGFDASRVRSFDDLRRLPILTKADIQEYRESLISTAYDRQQLLVNRTGGSTGSPLQFYYDERHRDLREAATVRHNMWAGYPLGSKVAVVWGHPSDLARMQSPGVKLRNLLIDRLLFCDSSGFSSDTLRRFARDYQRFAPDVILAYANSLALVVDFMSANSIELPRPKSIVTSAELLTAENREKIEGYFCAKVFDRYGARETSVIASECVAHDGLHIGTEYLHLEVVNQEGEPAGAGESGDILITNLANRAFPFIRYRIGDVGAIAPDSQCSCGIRLPRMQMIAGRTTDFLLAPDGRKVSGAALTIYLAAKVPGVRQAQIVQRERLTLVLNLAVDPCFGPGSRETIEAKVRYFFGDEMKVSYNYVDGIARESSGKYRFSICELS